MKQKLIRVTTIPLSLDKLLEGQLNFLNKFYQVIAVSSSGDQLQKVSLRENVQVVPIDMERTISPMKDLVSLWKLYLLFKREKPAIVHSITPKAGLLSMIAAYFAHVPIRIHTFTGLVFPTKKGFLKQLLIVMDKILCLFATNIYPEGKGVKRDLICFKITKKPLKVLANGNINGIDLNYYKASTISEIERLKLKKELAISNDDFVFIFVGRLVGDKGINELITAFKKLQNQLYLTKKSETRLHDRKTARLLLVGSLESDLDPLKKETLEEFKNNQAIISVGYQDDVRSYLAISNALVFPSYREGFPNVILQAGAMGLPSIVTNINGCNEIIEESENGLIIPSENINSLCNAMMKMVEDSKLRNHLSMKARSMIKSRFEQQLVWDAILAEYKTLEKKLPS